MSAELTNRQRPASWTGAHGFPGAPASWHRAVAGRAGCVRARAAQAVRGIEVTGQIGRRLHVAKAKGIFQIDQVLKVFLEWLLQRAHHFEISRFDRKRLPLRLWLAHAHFFPRRYEAGGWLSWDRPPRRRAVAAIDRTNMRPGLDADASSPAVWCEWPCGGLHNCSPGRLLYRHSLVACRPLTGPTTPSADPRPRNLRPGSRRRIVRPPAETVRSPCDSRRPTPATVDSPQTTRGRHGGVRE